MVDVLLSCPPFRRADEYLGLWSFEPERFAAMWCAIAAEDMVRHMAAAPRGQPVQSSLELAPGKGGQSVAVVKAVGTLMKQQSSFGGTSTIQLRRDIRQAAADDSVSGILLAFDSPGGTVAGVADLAADVRAAAKRKPVWAHVDDLTASAAYWVASQADAIYANSATALVGSIGTIMTVYDASKAADAEGISVRVFATGPLKGAGTPGTEITSEQAAYFQRMVDATQAHFDAAVRQGRGMSASDLAAVRSGGVWLADEAIGLKLIDGIRPLEKTLSALAGAK